MRKSSCTEGESTEEEDDEDLQQDKCTICLCEFEHDEDVRLVTADL